jgi:hypothetical protein
MGADPGTGIHQDQRLENFTWMNNGQLSEPVDTILIPMSPCFASRPQIKNCSRSRPANKGWRIRRRAF